MNKGCAESFQPRGCQREREDMLDEQGLHAGPGHQLVQNLRYCVHECVELASVRSPIRRVGRPCISKRG